LNTINREDNITNQ